MTKEQIKAFRLNQSTKSMRVNQEDSPFNIHWKVILLKR